MISKELFAEVMADKLPQGLCELNDLVQDDDNDVGYFHAQYQGYIDYGIQWINIHELAHKCKKWAFNQNYWLDSRITFNKGGARIEERHSDFIKDPKDFTEKTEPEAVFKACQWILDNK